MQPDPVDLVTEALQRRSALDIHRGDVMDSLNILRHHGLEIVRFGVGYEQPRIPLHAHWCNEGTVIIERWPGDDSHKAVRR